MKIEHIALWTNELERSRAFYETYFGAVSNTKYSNSTRNFESYFLTFEDGARLELMQMSGAASHPGIRTIGWAHIAVAVGSRDAVDALTERLRAEGYTIAGEARVTGDGCYESVVLDPDGNAIEITV